MEIPFINLSLSSNKLTYTTNSFYNLWLYSNECKKIYSPIPLSKWCNNLGLYWTQLSKYYVHHDITTQ